MKATYLFLFAALLLASCQPPPPPPVDNSAKEAFAANSATVMSYLESFQNESVDYSIFADDYVQAGTRFGGPDSTLLAGLKESHVGLFKGFDFKLLTDPVNLLPGVSAETKEMDGSVRYYGEWEVTRSSTDSTAAKTASFQNYASYDFNSDGKVLFSQFYGDVGGLFGHLLEMDEEE